MKMNVWEVYPNQVWGDISSSTENNTSLKLYIASYNSTIHSVKLCFISELSEGEREDVGESMLIFLP